MQKLTERQNDMLGALKDAYWVMGALSTKDLAERFKHKYNSRSVISTLTALEKRGLVRSVGKQGNATLWMGSE